LLWKNRTLISNSIVAMVISVVSLAGCTCCLVAVLGKEPTFDTPLANATTEVGSTALLPCAIDYLGKYKVFILLIPMVGGRGHDCILSVHSAPS